MKTSTQQRARFLSARPRSSAIPAIAVSGLAAVVLSVLAPEPALAEPDIPAGAHFTSWADNGKGGEVVLQLVKGDLPTVALVTSRALPGASLSWRLAHPYSSFAVLAVLQDFAT